jgi:hypothetical protein
MRRLRDNRVVKMTGWTFAEYDEQPAARVDWLLAVEDAITSAENNRAKAKAPKDRRPR